MLSIQNIAMQFGASPHARIQPFGEGNINSTWAVYCEKNPNNIDFLLQKINENIFKNPHAVMNNMVQVIEHLSAKKQNASSQTLRLRPSKPPLFYYEDQPNQLWRALVFIPSSTYERCQNLAQAREIGRILGAFHSQIADLSCENLVDILPDFHIAPDYFKQYIHAKNLHKTKNIAAFDAFILAREAQLFRLEDAKKTGILPLRPIHGDPKIGNILFDKNTQHAITLIDLDTVKPGLLHYDIGDALRSLANTHGEENTQATTEFCLARAEQFLTAYLPYIHDIFSAQEYDYLYDCIWLLPLELGMRFLTDYYQDNIYFSAKYPEHNLDRAKIQFDLCAAIERQKSDILAIIQQCKPTH